MTKAASLEATGHRNVCHWFSPAMNSPKAGQSSPTRLPNRTSKPHSSSPAASIEPERTARSLSSALGYQIINFTPGTRSNADYTTDDDKNYISSDAILSKIKEYEFKDPNGLNGFILLTHIGSGPKRTDKFHSRVDELIEWLKMKGYEPERVDEILMQKQDR